jgi:hypothetical protein
MITKVILNCFYYCNETKKIYMYDTIINLNSFLIHFSILFIFVLILYIFILYHKNSNILHSNILHSNE